MQFKNVSCFFPCHHMHAWRHRVKVTLLRSVCLRNTASSKLNIIVSKDEFNFKFPLCKQEIHDSVRL